MKEKAVFPKKCDEPYSLKYCFSKNTPIIFMFTKYCFVAFVATFWLLSNNSQAQKKTKEVWNYLTDTKTAEEILTVENKLERLAYMFQGEFTNEDVAKVANSPLYQHQDMICVPIWTDRRGEYWLYWGWFKHGQPERCLAQAVWQISRLNRDTFELKFYRLPEEEQENYYPFEWRKEKPFANIRIKELIYTGGTYAITEVKENLYKLHPLAKPQAYPMSEKIKNINLSIELDPTKQQHFTNFYDENIVKIFGYDDTEDGNFFTRRPKNNPYYRPLTPKEKKAKAKKEKKDKK
jgi:hypothetical protein